MPTSKSIIKVGTIQKRILLIRGEKVIVDADLAEAYGVTTKALNQAIRRNKDRFPDDFMFQLTKEEKSEVVTNCDHLQKLKFSKVNPHVFTEHGTGACQFSRNLTGIPNRNHNHNPNRKS